MSEERECIVDSDGPVHYFFGLSYSNYLVLRRSHLQSMPHEWQEKFVALMDEMEAAFDLSGVPSRCVVTWRDKRNKFMADTVPHYNRGRTRIATKPPDTTS